MRAVIQRVTEAKVTVDGKIEGEIGLGVLIFLGIVSDDTSEDIQWLSKKIVNLRIFNDNNTVMNLSLKDQKGEALIVSQFTLHA
ncbi:MAG: D-aminoacyl-tRNA deacylase, partial [Bacteroidetes bacterium]|nr:D-aminoacyl-tRNA deacylase [Bacteroidota bacterium]